MRCSIYGYWWSISSTTNTQGIQTFNLLVFLFGISVHICAHLIYTSSSAAVLFKRIKPGEISAQLPDKWYLAVNETDVCTKPSNQVVERQNGIYLFYHQNFELRDFSTFPRIQLNRKQLMEILNGDWSKFEIDFRFDSISCSERMCGYAVRIIFDCILYIRQTLLFQFWLRYINAYVNV